MADEQSAPDIGATIDDDARVTVRSLDGFAELRQERPGASPHWWPQLGPASGADSFSFTHRRRRLGPITILDVDFHDEVWVDGGQTRPHYHVTLPVAASSATDGAVHVDAQPGSVAVYRPEGKAGLSGYLGRLLAVMIDRHAVEAALEEALGRSVSSQIDFHPLMSSTVQVARSWITMVTLFTEQLFRPSSLLHQPMVGLPFAESVVRGFLLATDHSFRATLDSDAGIAAPRAIREAMEVIEAEANRPLTVSELATISCTSVRSLQQGFQRHLGTTPMAYLRDVRLRRAHQTLLESDPSTETVAAIAYRWGFTNLGRFAAAHAARYHETPLKTLRRSAFQRSA